MENGEGRGMGGVTIRDPNSPTTPSPPTPSPPTPTFPPRPPLPDPSPRPQSPDPHLFLTHPPHYTRFASNRLRVKLSSRQVVLASSRSRQVCSRHIFRFKLSCSDTLDLIALRFSTSVASFYRFCACLLAAT